MSTTPRSLLVATDFSADAALAISRSVALAGALGIEDLRLLHVVEAPWLGALQQWLGMAMASQHGVVEEAQRAMDALVSAITKRSGRRPASRVVVGNLLDTLIEQAAKVDLLAIGARGQHRVRDFAVGTTGERLLRKRRGPILVVRRRPVRPYRRVLAPIDFSPHAVQVLRHATAIAPGAQVDLLHAFELPFESKLRLAGVTDDQINQQRVAARAQVVDRVAKLIAEADVDATRVHRRIEHGYPPRVIVETARRDNADLIVIGKHGESIMEDLLLGSVTLHVLGQTRCDVLVVSAP